MPGTCGHILADGAAEGAEKQSYNAEIAGIAEVKTGSPWWQQLRTARPGTKRAFISTMERPTSAEALNPLTSTIIDAAIRIHKAVGPGLLESAYFECLCFELALAGLRIETQKALPLVYRDVTVRCAYRADIVVEQTVVLEIKAVDRIAAIHSRQLYTYLRVADCRVGLVLNFSAPTMLDGIKRVVNNFPE